MYFEWQLRTYDDYVACRLMRDGTECVVGIIICENPPIAVISGFKPGFLTLDNIYTHIQKTPGIAATLVSTLNNVRSQLLCMAMKDTPLSEGAIYAYSDDHSLVEELENMREEEGDTLLEVIEAINAKKRGKVH